MKHLDASSLERRWVHSHEEDTQRELVFRPASYSFPPSRGRSAFELRADGSYAESAPGPTDRPEESEGGTWSLEGDVLELRAPDGSLRTLKVETAEPDRLVVRK
jgi:hypothetical protein